MSDAATVLALQDADFKLLQLRKRLEELPQRKQILALRAKVAELAPKAEKVAKMEAQARKSLSLLTDEQAITQRKLDEAQAKLAAGLAYKETAALTAEIDSLAKRISKLEDDELEQMEKLDKAAAVDAQVGEALARLKAQEQRLTEDYQHQGGAINAAIAHEQHLREQLLDRLPPALAARYEKALAAKGGIAAAHLEGDHCSACHVSFSPGQILKFKSQAAGANGAGGGGDNFIGISECPHCHRLLVMA
jgi:predicted  nucleic acid-binding Zn-ribbon protein